MRAAVHLCDISTLYLWTFPPGQGSLYVHEGETDSVFRAGCMLKLIRFNVLPCLGPRDILCRVRGGARSRHSDLSGKSRKMGVWVGRELRVA